MKNYLLLFCILSLSTNSFSQTTKEENNQLFWKKMYAAEYVLKVQHDTADYIERTNMARKLVDKPFFASSYYWYKYVKVLCENNKVPDALDEFQDLLQYQHFSPIQYDNLLGSYFEESDARWKVYMADSLWKHREEKRYGREAIALANKLLIMSFKDTVINGQKISMMLVRNKITDSLNLTKMSDFIEKYGYVIAQDLGLSINHFFELGEIDYNAQKQLDRLFSILQKDYRKGNIPVEVLAMFQDYCQTKYLGKPMIYGEQMGEGDALTYGFADLQHIDKLRSDLELAPLWVYAKMRNMNTPYGYTRTPDTNWEPMAK